MPLSLRTKLAGYEAIVVLVFRCVVRGCEGPVVVRKFFEMEVWVRAKENWGGP